MILLVLFGLISWITSQRKTALEESSAADGNRESLFR